MRIALAAIALAVCSCLGTVDNIPCDTSANCPTGYFCSSGGTCNGHPEAAPKVSFDGVRPKYSSGPFTGSVTIPASSVYSEVELQFSNGGGYAMLGEITLDGPACLHVGSQARQLDNGGSSFTVSATFGKVDPGCPSPATVTVTTHIRPDITLVNTFQVVLQ